MQIHRGMIHFCCEVLQMQTNMIQLYIPNGNQAAQGLGLRLLFALERIGQELIVPFTFLSRLAALHSIDLADHIFQPHMREAYLVLPQRHRTEMRIELAGIKQGIFLQILYVDAFECHTRRKTVFHRFHLHFGIQRTR